MPKIYYTDCDKATPYYVMEFFEPEIMENIDTLGPKLWTKENRFKVSKTYEIGKIWKYCKIKNIVI